MAPEEEADGPVNVSSNSSPWPKWIAWITVEPVNVLYCIMFTCSAIMRDNLYIDKVCLTEMKYNATTCRNLTDKGEVDIIIKQSIQKRVAVLESYDGILMSVPAIWFCLYAGPWSDCHGRKPLIVWPLVGNLLAYSAYIINVHYFDTLATECLLIAPAFLGLSGGFQCLNLGLYGYVADKSTAEWRTTRLSILNGSFSLAYVVGTQLGSALYNYLGNNYYVAFSISLALALMALVYVAALPESVNCSAAEPGRRSIFLFECAYIVDVIKTVFKQSRTPGSRRTIWILLWNFAVFTCCMATIRYNYLFFSLRLSWSLTEFSNYLSLERIWRLVTLFVILPSVSSSGCLCHIGDTILATIFALMTCVAYTVKAFSQLSSFVYASAFLHLNSAATVVIRSQLTKLVDPDEKGRIFAMVALVQTTASLVASPLFGAIYKSTLDSILPGTYLIVLSSALLSATLTSGYLMYFWSKIDRNSTETE